MMTGFALVQQKARNLLHLKAPHAAPLAALPTPLPPFALSVVLALALSALMMWIVLLALPQVSLTLLLDLYAEFRIHPT